MRIRLHGTPAENAATVAALACVLTIDAVSRPYRDRPPSTLERQYLDIGPVSGHRPASAPMTSHHPTTSFKPMTDEISYQPITPEARIALKNYDWLMRNRSDVELHWESGMLIWGDGGVDIREIMRPGLTPATEDQS
ncbi:hypothetical protein DMB66_27755 [Actinoplanes sp. ATCC 53533]|uniref:hypothetical protein n=1 Tax=Actinoplanes sp. ATCC 53533 TaxID=1288362 RepID=UPI000F797305|nr:hypothetical protein [Actinoplanes sp. ATCC 53533]RSM59483.1 hypothetical protein DMB66_27755 [Actinoplanes sp. ATCC 53533]